jgi:hypothetical protein
MLDQIPLAEIEQISYTTDIDRLLLTKSHAFYFCRLIGKLTAFFQLQEFSLRNLPVASSTTAARRSPLSSIRQHTSKVGNILPRMQHYALP